MISSTGIASSILSFNIYPGSQVVPWIAVAIGNSVSSWIVSPTNVVVTGVTTGSAGTGTVTGKMIFSSTGQVLTSLQAAGYQGIVAPGIAVVLENGIVAILNQTAQYVGTSSSVSSGSDTSKVVFVNIATLVSLLMVNFTASGIAGMLAPTFAVGVAGGIASIIQTGTGLGTIVPVTPAPGAAAGTSLSTIF